MRVMHIISCLVKTDGHSLFCMRLAERLHAQGHAQTVFTLPSARGEFPDPQGLVQHADGRLLRFLNVSLPFGLERQIAALALFFKPDVIHLHGGWHPVLFFGACVARRMGIPILLSLHGSLRPAVVEGDRRLRKRLAWHLYQRRLVQMSSLIHVSTEAEKEDLTRLGFDKPIAVVPNGIDIEDFSRKGGKTPSALTPLNLAPAAPAAVEPLNLCTSAQRDGTFEPSRPRTVLYLGRLHPLKGLDLLISAWAQVKVRSSLVHYCESALVGRAEDGGRRAEDGGQRTEDGGQRTEDGGRRAEDGGRRTEDGGQRTEDGKDASSFILHPSSFPNWQLVIAGPDEQGTLARLKTQAERLGLKVSSQPLTVQGEWAADGSRESDQDKRLTAYRSPFTDIVFIGPVYGERKGRLLSQADLFVLPTRSDNFGIAVAEALASGVPVISTKGAPWAELLGNSASALVHYCESSLVGNDQRSENGSQRSEVSGTNDLMNFRTNELTRTGRAGWWVDIGAEPLAEALREAMSLTDEQRRAMGENGRRLVERKYRWETVAEKMAAAYSACLRG